MARDKVELASSQPTAAPESSMVVSTERCLWIVFSVLVAVAAVVIDRAADSSSAEGAGSFQTTAPSYVIDWAESAKVCIGVWLLPCPQDSSTPSAGILCVWRHAVCCVSLRLAPPVCWVSLRLAPPVCWVSRRLALPLLLGFTALAIEIIPAALLTCPCIRFAVHHAGCIGANNEKY